MSVYFDIPDYLEAEVTKVNPRSEKHGPDERKSAMDINFAIVVSADFLNKLAITDKVDYEKVFFDKDGQIKHTSVKQIKFEREFENHRMAISFSTVDTDKTAQHFAVEKVCKFKADLEHGRCVKLMFQVQLHPHDEKDIGWLVKSCLEKQCYVRFEPTQTDLADEAEAA